MITETQTTQMVQEWAEGHNLRGEVDFFVNEFGHDIANLKFFRPGDVDNSPYMQVRVTRGIFDDGAVLAAYLNKRVPDLISKMESARA